MEILSIRELQMLVRAGNRDWKQYGEVNTTYYDGMLLFNYSQTAQFAGRWNYFERISRGLILDVVTGEVIARPFDKFFNYGERTNGTPIVNITEKLDGSLGVLYRNRGKYCIATRGSFTSEQAEWATEHLLANYDLTGLDDDLTLLFEIIYPNNRVVVDYKGWEGLALLGARNRHTGADLHFVDVDYLAQTYGFRTPKTYLFDSIEDILAVARELSANEEGWVILFEDGERLKVKGNAYRLAHKIMTGVTFSRVLEAVRDGLFDQMIQGVPDEFLGQIRAWRDEIEQTVGLIKHDVECSLVIAPQATQKEFALWVQANNSKNMQSYLFAAKQGRDITPLIYKLAFENRADKDRAQAVNEG